MAAKATTKKKAATKKASKKSSVKKTADDSTDTKSATAKKATAKKATAKKATKKKAVKKKTVKKKKKSAEPIRVKAFWGVFNHALKRVALYDYSQKRQAVTRAKELSTGNKTPHFVQKVKEPITE